MTYKHPPQNKIRIGNRIAVKRYSNDTLIRARLESLTDSSMILKGKTILLKDIKKIRTNTAKCITITGLSITAIFIFYYVYSDMTYQQKYDSEGSELHSSYMEYSTLGVMIGSVFAGIGQTFNYNIHRRWKIFVDEVYEKK